MQFSREIAHCAAKQGVHCVISALFVMYFSTVHSHILQELSTEISVDSWLSLSDFLHPTTPGQPSY